MKINTKTLKWPFVEHYLSTMEFLFEKLLAIIPIMFILELILGFNGRLLMIGNISIRSLLFASTAFILVVVTSFALKREEILFFDFKSEQSVFKLFDKFDYALATFILLNLVWVFIVPYFSGYGIKMAIKEVLSLNIFLLYYPVIILLRLNYIDWNKTSRLIKRSLYILALIHIFFYIGEMINRNATFVLNFFKSIEKLTNGHSQRPLVMLPDSYIRIIYPCSIFLILMFYYTIKSDLTKKDITFFIISLTALLTTLTKSLFFGVGISMLLFFIYSIIASRKYANMFSYHNIFKLIIIAIACSIFLNYAMFNNYVFIRLSSSFAYTTEQQKVEITLNKNNLDADKELAGTKRANFTRINQTKQLLAKWSKSPVVGFGYGSYIEDYPRSDTKTPYSYEMLFPSMLMKIGILGILVWIAFFLYALLYIIGKLGWKDKNAIAVLYIIVALGISSQFNPFLFNTSGMGILLFSFIEIKNIVLTEGYLNKNQSKNHASSFGLASISFGKSEGSAVNAVETR